MHHNQQPPPHVLNPQAVPTVNGAVHPDDINVLPGQVPTHVPTAQTQGIGAPIPNLPQGLVQPVLSQPVPVEEVEQHVEETVEETLEAEYIEEHEPETEEEAPIESGKHKFII
ncbi:hypothetical protein NQ317_006298 [Molorchus minor]|uniref:Uncharacterized protein n=1 Tax=Molorchus minor TaxID=1323400 RepID=A0ABQ9JJJ5_9CUCU|nr:hypothetical protein NQ317_006298 [Molorchus minor]